MAIYEIKVTLMVEGDNAQNAVDIASGFLDYAMEVGNDNGDIQSYSFDAQDEAGQVNATCQKCGSHLDGQYCSDDTCPYSEWPQAVPIDELQSIPSEELRSKYGLTPRVRIEAEVHDDARLNLIVFDAGAWFNQASDQEIFDLHEIGWGGDEAADVVALFFEETNEDIGALIVFCRSTQGTHNALGFECSVNADNAMDWLKQNRHGLWARLLCEDNGVMFSEAQEEEIKGMWDWLDEQGNACDHSFETIEDAAKNAIEVLGLKS